MSKVIISFAIKGAIHTPSMSPHLPVTPEIAESAVKAAEVGAAIVHLYGRNPDDSRPLATPDEARDILKLNGGDKGQVLT
jgi:uncharacterized protein (DUF849 family)